MADLAVLQQKYRQLTKAAEQESVIDPAEIAARHNASALCQGAGIAISRTMLNLVAGGAHNLYTIVLRTQPLHDVTLELTVKNAGNLVVYPQQLVFSPDNWYVPQLVRLAALDDFQLKSRRHRGLVFHEAHSADSNYSESLEIAAVQVFIVANEHGYLWTMGCGRNGRLGHGSNDQHDVPTLVEYFAGEPISADIALAERRKLVPNKPSARYHLSPRVRRVHNLASDDATADAIAFIKARSLKHPGSAANGMAQSNTSLAELAAFAAPGSHADRMRRAVSGGVGHHVTVQHAAVPHTTHHAGHRDAVASNTSAGNTATSPRMRHGSAAAGAAAPAAGAGAAVHPRRPSVAHHSASGSVATSSAGAGHGAGAGASTADSHGHHRAHHQHRRHRSAGGHSASAVRWTDRAAAVDSPVPRSAASEEAEPVDESRRVQDIIAGLLSDQNDAPVDSHGLTSAAIRQAREVATLAATPDSDGEGSQSGAVTPHTQAVIAKHFTTDRGPLQRRKSPMRGVDTRGIEGQPPPPPKLTESMQRLIAEGVTPAQAVALRQAEPKRKPIGVSSAAAESTDSDSDSEAHAGDPAAGGGDGGKREKLAPGQRTQPRSVALTQIACGSEHTMAASDKGDLYSWGAATHGQLGQGNLDEHRLPAPVTLPGRVLAASVSCGHFHSIVITNNGVMLTWGHNTEGQLGLGHTTDVCEPTVVSAMKGIVVTQAVGGEAHTLLLTTNKSGVYGTGRNTTGQLGLGHRASRVGARATGHVVTPQRVTALDGMGVFQIASGANHLAAVAASGHCFTWGFGGDGRLGHGDERTCVLPKVLRVRVQPARRAAREQRMAAATAAAAATATATATSGNSNPRRPAREVADEPHREEDADEQTAQALFRQKYELVRMVSCGGAHTALLTQNQEVYTFGLGSLGQLGHGSTASRRTPTLVKSLVGQNVCWIAVGSYHSSAVTDDGFLYTWGCGEDGSTGHGTSITGRSPVLPMLCKALVGTHVLAVACGRSHTAVLTDLRRTADDTTQREVLRRVSVRTRVAAAAGRLFGHKKQRSRRRIRRAWSQGRQRQQQQAEGAKEQDEEVERQQQRRKSHGHQHHNKRQQEHAAPSSTRQQRRRSTQHGAYRKAKDGGTAPLVRRSGAVALEATTVPKPVVTKRQSRIHFLDQARDQSFGMPARRAAHAAAYEHRKARLARTQRRKAAAAATPTAAARRGNGGDSDSSSDGSYSESVHIVLAHNQSAERMHAAIANLDTRVAAVDKATPTSRSSTPSATTSTHAVVRGSDMHTRVAPGTDSVASPGSTGTPTFAKSAEDVGGNDTAYSDDFAATDGSGDEDGSPRQEGKGGVSTDTGTGTGDGLGVIDTGVGGTFWRKRQELSDSPAHRAFPSPRWTQEVHAMLAGSQDAAAAARRLSQSRAQPREPGQHSGVQEAGPPNRRSSEVPLVAEDNDETAAALDEDSDVEAALEAWRQERAAKKHQQQHQQQPVESETQEAATPRVVSASRADRQRAGDDGEVHGASRHSRPTSAPAGTPAAGGGAARPAAAFVPPAVAQSHIRHSPYLTTPVVPHAPEGLDKVYQSRNRELLAARQPPARQTAGRRRPHSAAATRRARRAVGDDDGARYQRRSRAGLRPRSALATKRATATQRQEHPPPHALHDVRSSIRQGIRSAAVRPKAPSRPAQHRRRPKSARATPQSAGRQYMTHAGGAHGTAQQPQRRRGSGGATSRARQRRPHSAGPAAAARRRREDLKVLPLWPRRDSTSVATTTQTATSRRGSFPSNAVLMPRSVVSSAPDPQLQLQQLRTAFAVPSAIVRASTSHTVAQPTAEDVVVRTPRIDDELLAGVDLDMDLDMDMDADVHGADMLLARSVPQQQGAGSSFQIPIDARRLGRTRGRRGGRHEHRSGGGSSSADGGGVPSIVASPSFRDVWRELEDRRLQALQQRQKAEFLQS